MYGILADTCESCRQIEPVKTGRKSYCWQGHSERKVLKPVNEKYVNKDTVIELILKCRVKKIQSA